MTEHDPIERGVDGGRASGACLTLAELKVVGAVGTDTPDAQFQLVRFVGGSEGLGRQRPGHVGGEVDPGAGRGQRLAQQLDAVGVGRGPVHDPGGSAGTSTSARESGRGWWAAVPARPFSAHSRVSRVSTP